MKPRTFVILFALLSAGCLGPIDGTDPPSTPTTSTPNVAAANNNGTMAEDDDIEPPAFPPPLKKSWHFPVLESDVLWEINVAPNETFNFTISLNADLPERSLAAIEFTHFHPDWWESNPVMISGGVYRVHGRPLAYAEIAGQSVGLDQMTAEELYELIRGTNDAEFTFTTTLPAGRQYFIFGTENIPVELRITGESANTSGAASMRLIAKDPEMYRAHYASAETSGWNNTINVYHTNGRVWMGQLDFQPRYANNDLYISSFDFWQGDLEFRVDHETEVRSVDTLIGFPIIYMGMPNATHMRYEARAVNPGTTNGIPMHYAVAWDMPTENPWRYPIKIHPRHMGAIPSVPSPPDDADHPRDLPGYPALAKALELAKEHGRFT